MNEISQIYLGFKEMVICQTSLSFYLTIYFCLLVEDACFFSPFHSYKLHEGNILSRFLFLPDMFLDRTVLGSQVMWASE